MILYNVLLSVLYFKVHIDAYLCASPYYITIYNISAYYYYVLWTHFNQGTHYFKFAELCRLY